MAGLGGDRRCAAGDIGAGRVGGGGVKPEPAPGNGLPVTESLFISSTIAGGAGAEAGFGGGAAPPPPRCSAGEVYSSIDCGGVGAEEGLGGGRDGELTPLLSPDIGRPRLGNGNGWFGMVAQRAVHVQSSRFLAVGEGVKGKGKEGGFFFP